MEKHYTAAYNRKKKRSGRFFLFCLLVSGIAPFLSFAQQQTYTFTTAGATGVNGPSQTQVSAAYVLTNLSGSVVVTGGIQSFTVPTTGIYQILTIGASGGNPGSYPTKLGGLGSSMQGEFSLTQGDVLKILVGQKGDNGCGGSGGGGGSFVTGNNVLLIAAGGGGGGTSDNNGANSTTLTSGTNDNPGGVILGGTNGSGGQACNVAGAGANHGGGGGGYNGNGATSTASSPGAGGFSFINGGAGGSSYAPGGFGGGGGATNCTVGGGGGGGYSGGAGGQQVNYCLNGINRSGGGGGGSYNNGTNQVNTGGTNSGDGKVIITSLCNINLTSTSAAGTNTAICAGSSATLNTNAVSNYTWSTGANSSSLVVTPTVTTSYTLTATSPSNCVASSVITVTVDNTPTVTAIPASTAMCAGKPLTLSGAGATTYTWTGSITNAVTFTPSATLNYTVTGTNACGNATAVTAVTVNPLPNIGGSVNNPTVCNGSPVIFNGTGSVNGYTWTNGVTNNTAYTPAATNIYTVTGISANNCTNTAVVGVTVFVTPNIAPVATPTAICLNKTATLSAVGATGYTWIAPPTAAFSNANTVTVSPTGNTTYTLNRTNGNCASTMTVALVVNGLPSIIVGTPNPSVVCASSAASLSAVGAITYTWYPGGFQGSNITVYPNYSSSLINYTVVASNANCTISAVSSVSTNPNPTVTINATSTVICAGSATTLTANGASTYTWQSPINLAQQTVTVNPLIPSLYSVSGTNIYGCTSQQSQVILVNAAPNLTASIANPGNYICAGGIGTLVAVGTGPTNYSWSTGSTAASTTVNPISTTAYTVTGINPTTLCQSTGTVSLAVYISTFVVSSPTAICKGQTATLTASGAATSYSWSTNNAAASITLSPVTTSTYYVTGITGNCQTTQAVPLIVNSIPNVTANSAKITICRFEPGILTAGGATSYSWNTGANTNSITVTPTVTTTYTVTGTDNNGCSKTINITQYINACLGIAEMTNNVSDLLSIYPNPSSGNFTIKAGATVNVRIVNETGQLIKYLSLTDANNQAAISNLASGIYFIVVEKDGNTGTKKVVVE